MFKKANLLISDCTEVLTSLTGYFTTPNYPGNYPNNAICYWFIAVPADYTITVQFTSFNLDGSGTCLYGDSVVLSDTVSTAGP